MAIEYTLYLAHAAGVASFAQSLGQQLECTVTGRQEERLELEIDGIQAVVTEPDPVTRRFVNEDHSIEPRIHALIRLDKFRLEDAQHSLVQFVIAALRASTGDAILLFNGELLVLQRRLERVALSNGFGVWTPERRHRFESAFSLGDPLG